MPRGMIAAPPFMPPFGAAFPGGLPQMPPLPGGMPHMPSMPPQQPPPPPQAPQQQAPPQQMPQQQTPYQQTPYQQTPYQQAPYQQAPYQQAPYQQAPYQQLPYQPAPQPVPQQQIQTDELISGQAYPLPGQQPQGYPAYGYGAPTPAAAALLDPVLAQQLAALQQAVQALQGAVPQHTAQPEAAPSSVQVPPVEPHLVPKTELPSPPVSRVGPRETYTTKGRGIQFTTRG